MKEHSLNTKLPHNLTWMAHSRPGNKTPSVICVSAESEFQLKNKQIQRPEDKKYAQVLILVNLILVNLFCLLVITWNPPEHF